MAYSDFDLKTALRAFGLTHQNDMNLFSGIEPIVPSPFLVDWLAEFAPVAQGMNTEMMRSSYIIMPILAEAKRRAGPPVNVLAGVGFEVDRAQGLTGFCDYLIARSSSLYYIEAPVVAVVEAKKEDIIGGLGQCVAEMVAIRLFNEREHSPVPIIHGCVTSGTNWRFLKLDGPILSIDHVEYYLSNVAKILGILVKVIQA